MERKFLTESARITDAYAQMYSKKPVNESRNENGNLLGSLKGQLPIDGKGSSRTGSKLGRRPVLPFEKRDAKNNCGHSVPMKKTFGNGKVKTGPTDTRKIEHVIPSKTGSKLGVRKVLPFEKRDENPTSIGKIGKVNNISCVKGVRESEESDIEITSISGIDGDSEKDIECDCGSAEALDLVMGALEQIYDNLTDEDKDTIDEVRNEVEKILNPDEDDDGENDDGDLSDGDVEECSVNEGIGGEILKKGFGAAKKFFKGGAKVLWQGKNLTKCQKAIELMKKAKTVKGAGRDAAMKEAKKAYKEAMSGLSKSEKAEFEKMIRAEGISITKTGGKVTDITRKTATAAEKEAGQAAKKELTGGVKGAMGSTAGKVVAGAGAGAAGAALVSHLTTDDGKAKDVEGKEGLQLGNPDAPKVGTGDALIPNGGLSDADIQDALERKYYENLRAKFERKDNPDSKDSSNKGSSGSVLGGIAEFPGKLIGGLGKGVGDAVSGIAGGVGSGVGALGKGAGDAVGGIVGGVAAPFKSADSGSTAAKTDTSSAKPDATTSNDKK